jgi:hypothetical protein
MPNASYSWKFLISEGFSYLPDMICVDLSEKIILQSIIVSYSSSGFRIVYLRHISAAVSVNL